MLSDRNARRQRRRVSPAGARARRAGVEDSAVVLDAALRFLEARHRSVAEVRRRLTQAGYREDLVTAAIGRLGDLGMLDDAAFAVLWVESRDRARPRGERALRMELRQKGIDPETIARALADRHQPVAEAGEPSISADEDAARRLLARHARTLDRVSDPRARRQRAYAVLARNGFDPDVSSSVVAAWLAGSVDDSAE